MREYLNRLPKAELHLHIEGCLEPGMMVELARRNGYQLPWPDDEVRAAFDFTDLQSFLDVYYQGAAVLQTERDFYELMSAYLDRAAGDGVRRAEIFFDPQTHTERGISFPVFMSGLRQGISDAERRHGISADLILCFVRHLTGDDALRTLREAEPHLERVIAVGLDSSERGRPPELFEAAFAAARDLGLRAVAHAGEEGPASYVRGALDVLGAERIDHGVRSLDDPDLVARLRAERVPLTVCPLSNVALGVVQRLADHPFPRMVDEGLAVSINSDDPAYFGSYIGANYVAVAEEFGYDADFMADLARGSIDASFLPPEEKKRLVAAVDEAQASRV